MRPVRWKLRIALAAIPLAAWVLCRNLPAHFDKLFEINSYGVQVWHGFGCFIVSHVPMLARLSDAELRSLVSAYLGRTSAPSARSDAYLYAAEWVDPPVFRAALEQMVRQQIVGEAYVYFGPRATPWHGCKKLPTGFGASGLWSGFMIADWVPAAALTPFLAPLLLGFWTARRRRARRNRDQCGTCGYPTVGLPSRRCPECGTSF